MIKSKGLKPKISRATIPTLTAVQLGRISDQDFRKMQQKTPELARGVLNRANELARERRREALTFFEQNPHFPVPVTYQEYKEGARYKSWRYADFNEVKTKDKNKQLSSYVTTMKFLSTRESEIKNWKAEIADMAERTGFRGQEANSSAYNMFWRIASRLYEFTSGTDYRYTSSEEQKGYSTKLQQLIRKYMSQHTYRLVSEYGDKAEEYLNRAVSELSEIIKNEYELRIETEIQASELERERIAKNKKTNTKFKPIR